jgi:FkbM family methyltransferase
MSELPGFRRERGLLWPDMDVECAKVIFDMMTDIDIVLRYVTDFSTCVQAGGNCGLWPRALAPKFGAVYTAEPHTLNFAALVANTVEFPNVVRFQAAFGDERGFVEMSLDPKEKHNCGAFYVKPGGIVPTLKVDDLALPKCGLIYLDVEGFEESVLHGAGMTIDRCQPVIAVEAKGLARRYGKTDASCQRLIESRGYEVACKTNRDVIFTRPRRAK